MAILFKDAKEVVELFKELFNRAANVASIAKQAKNSSFVLKLNLKNPEATLFIDCRDGYLKCLEKGEELKLDIELTMTSEIAHKFWLGRLNMIVAGAKREIVAKGNVNKLTGFLPVLKKISETYKNVLKERGREDLIK